LEVDGVVIAEGIWHPVVSTGDGLEYGSREVVATGVLDGGDAALGCAASEFGRSIRELPVDVL
jgi:hypothetical protein